MLQAGPAGLGGQISVRAYAPNYERHRPEQTLLYQIIDKHYPDFLAQLAAEGEWGDAFPNKLLGTATLDRLRHGAYRLVLDGESYRTPRPLAEEGK